MAAIWTLFFTKELYVCGKNNCPKFEKLSHQKLQLNFYQNWFTGVSKCPLLTGNKELFELEAKTMGPKIVVLLLSL